MDVEYDVEENEKKIKFVQSFKKNLIFMENNCIDSVHFCKSENKQQIITSSVCMNFAKCFGHKKCLFIYIYMIF